MEHIVNYDYYLHIYEGTDIEDEDVFNKIRNTAEEVILALVNPSFVEKNIEDIKYTICLEIDYLNDNGYEQIVVGKDSANYQSESYPRLLIPQRSKCSCNKNNCRNYNSTNSRNIFIEARVVV